MRRTLTIRLPEALVAEAAKLDADIRRNLDLLGAALDGTRGRPRSPE